MEDVFGNLGVVLRAAAKHPALARRALRVSDTLPQSIILPGSGLGAPLKRAVFGK